MQFEWDEHKNKANISKHGIDFETATRLWDDPYRIEIQTSFTEEDRIVLIGKIDKKLWSAIFTSRDAACRIISARRARKKEAMLYEKSKIS